MDFDFNKKIWLDASKMKDKESLYSYMKEIFELPEYFGNNLDALSDSLSEVSEPIDILLTRQCVKEICEDEYAFKVLIVLGEAANNNPYLHLLFRK